MSENKTIDSRALVTFVRIQRDLDERFKLLDKTLSKPRSALALIKPNLPEVLEEGLCELARVLLSGTSWSITLGGREIGSSVSAFPAIKRSLPTLQLTFGPDSFLRVTPPGSRAGSRIAEFQLFGSQLTEITITYQKKLLKRLLPGGERAADDDVYRSLWPTDDLGGAVRLLNLSRVSDTGNEVEMTRLLSGPETAKRLMDRLVGNELLRRDVLASMDLILNWNFLFKDTNTYKAFMSQIEGRQTLYFPKWWTTGAPSYSNPNAILSNTLRRGMQSSAVFGESDYLLAPFHRTRSRMLTLSIRGAPQDDLEREAGKLKIEPNLVERLVLPGRFGYELYDAWLQNIEWQISRALGIMSETPHLSRGQSEETMTWDLVRLLKMTLEGGSGWSVNPETSHGASKKEEGHPDLLLRYTLEPELTVIGECKRMDNIPGVFHQLAGYVGVTTNAALLIVYKLERTMNAWDILQTKLVAEAASAELGLEPILEVPTPNGAVWEGVTWLHIKAEPVTSVPLRIFLADLSR